MSDKVTNKKFASDEGFIKACEEAKVAPTQRQASKFRNQKGAAWKMFKILSRKEVNENG